VFEDYAAYEEAAEKVVKRAEEKQRGKRGSGRRGEGERRQEAQDMV